MGGPGCIGIYGRILLPQLSHQAHCHLLQPRLHPAAPPKGYDFKLTIWDEIESEITAIFSIWPLNYFSPPNLSEFEGKVLGFHHRYLAILIFIILVCAILKVKYMLLAFFTQLTMLILKIAYIFFQVKYIF